MIDVPWIYIKKRIQDKLIFGTDLDGVNYDFPHSWDSFLTSNGVNIDRTDAQAGLTKEENDFYMSKFLETHPYLWIPLIEGAMKSMTDISKMYKLMPTTSRGNYKYGLIDTMIRLKSDKFPYYKVSFNADKGEVAEKYHFVGFIEDFLHHAINVKIKSPETRVYLINTSYNSGDESKYDIVRVKDLGEIVKIEKSLLQ